MMGYAASPPPSWADASRASTRIGGTPHTPEESPGFGVGGAVDELGRRVEGVVEAARAGGSRVGELERELRGERERVARVWGELAEERR